MGEGVRAEAGAIALIWVGAGRLGEGWEVGWGLGLGFGALLVGSGCGNYSHSFL